MTETMWSVSFFRWVCTCFLPCKQSFEQSGNKCTVLHQPSYNYTHEWHRCNKLLQVLPNLSTLPDSVSTTAISAW